MNKLDTPRLQLLELSFQQLQLCLFDLPEFEKQTNIKIDPDFITDRVLRAMRMKVEKMRNADIHHHAWMTYWLIVIKEENIGAGMLGFKGHPNIAGATEIGYGIGPSYQNKGYMAEAVQALIDWAFTYPACNIITATEVENPASRRLLEKLGAQLVGQTATSTSWELRKIPE